MKKLLGILIMLMFVGNLYAAAGIDSLYLEELTHTGTNRTVVYGDSIDFDATGAGDDTAMVYAPIHIDGFSDIRLLLFGNSVDSIETAVQPIAMLPDTAEGLGWAVMDTSGAQLAIKWKNLSLFSGYRYLRLRFIAVAKDVADNDMPNFQVRLIKYNPWSPIYPPTQ